MKNITTIIICIVAAMIAIANMVEGTARVIISGAAAVVSTILLIATIIKMKRGDEDEE